MSDVPITVTYTVKTLDMGGCEVEFPTTDHLRQIRELLDAKYPKLEWHASSYRYEATLEVGKRRRAHQILIRLGNVETRERKMWLSGQPEYVNNWLATELNELFTKCKADELK